MQLLIPYFYKGYIYQIINIQNRKSYIGKTTNEDPIKYINEHFENAYKKEIDEETGEEKYDNKQFYNAIRKYGRQNFKWIILGEVFRNSKEDLRLNLNEAEITCIYHFRTFGSDGKHQNTIYGYNLTKGGDGGDTFTGNPNKEEIRKKWQNRIQSESSNNKRSENAKINSNYGMKNKHHSEETKQILSKINSKTFSEKFGPEKAKIISQQFSIARKNKNNPNAKKYIVITPEGEKIFLWGAFTNFCKENHLKQSKMYDVSLGKLDNYKGYKCKKVYD